MQQLVTALNTEITLDALWANITAFAPLIITMVLFAFGYRIVKRVIRGTSRGKASI